MNLDMGGKFIIEKYYSLFFSQIIQGKYSFYPIRRFTCTPVQTLVPNLLHVLKILGLSGNLHCIPTADLKSGN